MRAGAASGLIAIAVQNLWETGLRMPANAVLCALSLAIAIHRPSAPLVAPQERDRNADVRRPRRPAV
jgi:hypothetical protein